METVDPHPVISGLEQAARMMERIPPVTQDDYIEVRKSLAEHLAANGLTQIQFGKAVGLSGTVISQILNGKYPGDMPEAVKKITAELNRAHRREAMASKRPGYVETSVALAIKTLIDAVDTFSNDGEGRIGVIIGDSGHGKTKCLEAYAKKNNDCILVKLDNSQGVKSMLTDICDVLEESKNIKIRTDGCVDWTVKQLRQQIFSRHLIVMLDEASGLRVQHLDALRQIITIKCNCPLILSGNAALAETIGQRTGRRGCQSLDQFRSRLVQTLNLDAIAAGGGGGGLYTTEDIEKLYSYGGIKLTKNAIETIKRICRVPLTGRLRTAATIIQALHTSPEVQRAGVIDATLIAQAVTALGLSVTVPVVDVKADGEADEMQQVSAAG